MQCSQCQRENPEDAKFCNQCGTPFAPQCSSCGRENASDAKFCNQCATPLARPTPVPSPVQSIQYGSDAESRFHAMLSAVMWWLQRERRVTYRTLKHVFDLDGVLLEEIRKELTFREVARDEQGEGLVWTGETQPVIRPEVASTRPPAS